MSWNEVGPRYISGVADRGRITLRRNDDTVESTPVLMFTGTLEGNGDGTATLMTTDEE